MTFLASHNRRWRQRREFGLFLVVAGAQTAADVRGRVLGFSVVFSDFQCTFNATSVSRIALQLKGAQQFVLLTSSVRVSVL